ncbi:MAG: DMT family transporter [Pseudomonadales bacterium]|nr:DMT family transporter [Pseudomonadales bacterium]
MLRLVILTVLTLFAFACNSLLARAALGHSQIDAAGFTLLRIGSGAIFLLLLVLFQGRKPAGSWLGGLWLSVYALTFSAAYLMLETGIGALLLFGAVQITMIAIGLKRGEVTPLLSYVGVVIAFFGLMLLVQAGFGQNLSLLGVGLMLLAGVAWGAYTLHRNDIVDPTAVTAGNFLCALPIVCIVALPFLDVNKITPSGVGLAVTSGALTSGLGYVLWSRISPLLGTVRAAALQLTVPLIAACCGLILLAEPITLRFGISAGLIIGGISLTLMKYKRA